MGRQLRETPLDTDVASTGWQHVFHLDAGPPVGVPALSLPNGTVDAVACCVRNDLPKHGGRARQEGWRPALNRFAPNLLVSIQPIGNESWRVAEAAVSPHDPSQFPKP